METETDAVDVLVELTEGQFSSAQIESPACFTETQMQPAVNLTEAREQRYLSLLQVW